ncbi:MAG: MBOAT family protein [Ruminococcaceae bacterium]|nr:MBOAT family protein [Oscillospiraceae bacterium]
MLFSSIPFLYYFLPAVLILYFAAPKKLKNTVILLSSLFFYGWGEPKYVFLMAFSILAAYVFGIFVEKYRDRTVGKILCGVSVAVSLSFLLYFKYTDFFIDNFNRVFGTDTALLKIALPVGISFYTFQIISYTVDVYRGEPSQKNIISLAAYVTMFPQLIAGPIVRYSDIARQLSDRQHSFTKAGEGIRRFILGLGKKIIIANQLGELCDVFRASGEKSVLFYWLYAVAFALHVYFDFSGYSDMAIGLGKIFAFDFLENFNYPYISASVSEFWRRWHMSLGSWFRDYVYIPMGGNRVKPSRQLLNILVVWMLTGFWHGAAWNFIIWGLYFAVFLTVEKFWLGKYIKKSKVISHVYVLLTVLISFVIFNAPDMKTAFSDIGGLFGAGGIPLASPEALYCLADYGVLLIIGIIGATPLVKKLFVRLWDVKGVKTVLAVCEPVFLLGLLTVMTAFLVDGSFNPFLYFRF